jgi:hypothetical protein
MNRPSLKTQDREVVLMRLFEKASLALIRVSKQDIHPGCWVEKSQRQFLSMMNAMKDHGVGRVEEENDSLHSC